MTQRIDFDRDEDCEMVRIVIGTKCVFEGSYWDLDMFAVVNLLEEAGHTVHEGEYSYES